MSNISDLNISVGGALDTLKQGLVQEILPQLRGVTEQLGPACAGLCATAVSKLGAVGALLGPLACAPLCTEYVKLSLTHI
jgi:hypothetical protein